MAAEGTGRGAILARKLAGPAGGPRRPAELTPERALAQALTRAAQAELSLDLACDAAAVSERSLAELIEGAEAADFLAVLTGPRERVALLSLDAGAHSALVEMMTVSRVNPLAPAARRPTRTDAAMLAPFIDASLSALDALSLGLSALSGLGGYAFGSFFDEPRPLMMVLEDVAYRQITLRLRFSGLAEREGLLRLALPDAASARPALPPVSLPGSPAPAPGATPAFTEALRERLLTAPVRVEAVLARSRFSIADLLSWQPGQMVPLAEAGLDDLALCGPDRKPLARMRLGQHRGLRALRLVPGGFDHRGIIEEGPGSAERASLLARASAQSEPMELRDHAAWDEDRSSDLNFAALATAEPEALPMSLASFSGQEGDVTHVSDLPPLTELPELGDLAPLQMDFAAFGTG